MLLVVIPLAEAVSEAVLTLTVTMAKSLAQNLWVDEFASKIKDLFSRLGLNHQITSAIKAAFKQFETSLHDPELLHRLAEQPQFETDQQIVAVLAQAMTQPLHQHEQVDQLTGRLRHYLPTVDATRCRRAAEVLIQAVHSQAQRIPQLQRGLSYLLQEEIGEAVHRVANPPYQKGLDAAILVAADRLQQELEHHYVASAHILYGVMVQPDGIAAQLLGGLSVSTARVRLAVKNVVAPDPDALPGAMSPTVGAVLTLARQVAGERLSYETRSEHVLEALARQVQRDTGRKTTLAIVFRFLGLDADAVIAQIITRCSATSRFQSFFESFGY